MLGLKPISGGPISGLQTVPADSISSVLVKGNLVYLAEITIANYRSGILADGGTAATTTFDLDYDGGTAATTAFGRELDGGSAESDPLRFADRQYTTGPTDTPENWYYEPRAQVPLELSRSVSLSPESINDGSQRGSVRLLNADGALDSTIDTEAVDGQTVTVKVGAIDDPLSRFGTAWIGQGVSWATSRSGNEVEVKLRDSTFRLERPVAPVYESTYDGITIEAGLVGRPQPLAYGQVRHAEPVLIDSTNRIYQIHAGSVEAIQEVRVRGEQWTDDGDTTDLLTGAPTSGKYFRTDEASGLIQLGQDADGFVTVTLKGGNASGYVSTIPDIAKQILLDFGLSTDYLESASFDTLATSVSGVGGIYIREEARAKDILTKLLKGIGGYWYVRRSGKIAVDRLSEPVPSEAVLELDELNILSLRRMSLPDALNPPQWRRRVGYQKTWRDLSGDLSTAVPASEISELTEPWRYTSASDATIKNTHALAQDPPLLESHLDAKADADSLASTLLSLHGTEREMYEVQIDSRGVQVDYGSTVKVTYGRFNLSGKSFRAFPVRETPKDRTVTLALWG